MTDDAINSHLSQPKGDSSHPAAGPWWPSRYGPQDERGALNEIGPRQILQAAKLVQNGRCVPLGFGLRPGEPDFHHRDFNIVSAGAPSGGPLGPDRLVYNDEVIAGRFTGMATHFNSLAHVGRQLGQDGDLNGIHYYNGFSHAEIGGPWGFRKLGIEGIGPIFIPGLLVDLSQVRRSPLMHGEEITVGDLEEALDHQGLSAANIQRGSALFWRTGRDVMWHEDRESYLKGSPGISAETARWIAGKGVVVVGADAVAMEPIPPISAQLADVHATFLCYSGVYIIVNLNLQQLSQLAVWQFAFACAPVPFVGAQGSPVMPFALI